MSPRLELIRNFHLNGRRDDAALRVAEVMAQSSLHPPGLPEEAILVVRSVSQQWHPEMAPQARANQLRVTMGELLRRAQRPALGWVDPNAEVILFSSQAELLACLALAGVLRWERWWWKSLSLQPERFLEAWAEAADLLPALVGHLLAWERLDLVLAQISVGESQNLLQVFLQKFAFSSLLVKRIPLSRLSRPPRPWARWWSGGETLPPPVELLAGLSLCLVYEEPLVRRESFLASVERWLAEVEAPAPSLPVVSVRNFSETLLPEMQLPEIPPLLPTAFISPSHPEEVSPLLPVFPTIAEASSEIPNTNLHTVAPPRLQENPFVPPVADPVAISTESSSERPSSPSPPPSSPDFPLPLGSLADSPSATPLRPSEPSLSSPSPSVNAPAEPPIEWLPLPPMEFETELGGAFYLVNVAITLEIYGDFSQPLHPGPGLPLWDFIAEFTRRLLETPQPPDLLWGLLARLSGRPRLDGKKEIAGEPEDYAPPGCYSERTDQEEWFAQQELRIRERIAEAMDLPASRWLRQTARLRIGEARIDIYFSLADHPIELRLAGLDRDPGWVPAAGRSLFFHYDLWADSGTNR